MPTLQQKIAEKFLAKLASSKDVDATKIDELRKPLAESGKKPKAEDFLRILTLPLPRESIFPMREDAQRATTCGIWRIHAREAASAAVKITGFGVGT